MIVIVSMMIVFVTKIINHDKENVNDMTPNGGDRYENVVNTEEIIALLREEGEGNQEESSMKLTVPIFSRS